MGDRKPQQVFVSQSLSGSSYTVNRNTLIHNLITMPLHQGTENPTRLPNKSINQSSTSVKSSTNDAIKKAGEKTNKYLVNIVAGTAVAPLERVYTLIQCQNDLVKTGRISSPYKGMKDCFLRTIRHEGFFSLWRAASILLSNVFAYPFQYAQVRLINDVKPVTRIQFSLDSTAKTMTSNAAHRQFSSALDVVSKTLMSDGFPGLYRGYTITCIRLFSYLQASNFAFRSRNITLERRLFRPGWSFIPGSVPDVRSNVALYPIGTVSSRMMMTSGEVNKYKGPIDALFQIVRKEGVCSLYKGLTPYCIRSISI
ncbi:hypothetical protein RND81_06G106500 [Saponaria officinalis]|uniref:ADP/ATP translocase n=1 Tax=Saponaria officinalis TaxID=3572 RepID=A0AAW1KC36_SAPOF